MTEKELQIIKNHLAAGKMTAAVKEAIKVCLQENAALTKVNNDLATQKKQLMNRCKVLTGGTMCMFCGFREECHGEIKN